jgi:hypothetical protein
MGYGRMKKRLSGICPPLRAWPTPVGTPRKSAGRISNVTSTGVVMPRRNRLVLFQLVLANRVGAASSNCRWHLSCLY